MTGWSGRQGGRAERSLSAPELLCYLVAAAYAVAGVAVTPVPGGLPSVAWLLEAAATVGVAALVVVVALSLRRSGLVRADWWRVAGGYVAGVGAATTLLVWLTAVDAAGAVVPLAATPSLDPGLLRPDAALVAVGNAGGALGLALGWQRARAAARERSPELLLGNASTAAWLFDADYTETRYVNPAYERLFGQPTAALRDDPTALAEAVHPADREALGERMSRLADGEAVEFELRVAPDAPGERWAWVSGTPVRRGGEVVAVACLAHDVTGRRQHREQLVSLHDATRRLFRAETGQAAAEIATAAAEEVLDLRVNTIWLYDEADEELVPAAATEGAEAATRSLPTFRAGDSLAWKVFESGEAQVYDDVRTAPGGTEARPTRSEIVLPLGEFGVFMAGSTTADSFDDRQVSLAKVLAANAEVALDRIDRHRELERSREALERRNERLDEFTSVVSHDLRNPLAVARGHLEMVREGTDAGHVETVADALERMESLVDDLLALAREGREIDDPAPVALDEVVRRCWATAETGEADLIATAEGTVLADESRLAQLFENLFRNAVEHGSAGDAPVTVIVGDLPDGFYVADDGPGIPATERGSVFEAGYSTDSGGTGFGLSIVATIAEAHGWTVEVTESEAGGARFEVTGVAVE
jgi:PAS domain S-box-containing protein